MLKKGEIYLKWQEKLKDYLKILDESEEFENEITIWGMHEKYVICIVTFNKKTFLYCLFITKKGEERLLVFNLFHPLRYRKNLKDNAIKNSFKWIEKKYCVMFDECLED